MFWIIITIILWILSAYLYNERNMGDASFNVSAFSFLTGIIAVCVFLSGLCTYPDLIGRRESIRAYQQNIELVRSARFTSDPAPTALVSGSIENVQQGSRMHEYLIDYTASVAEYNKKLASIRAVKELFLFKLFGDVLFIDKRAYDLELIH